MNDLGYTVAPIHAWPELLTSDRERSKFSAPWSGRRYESWQTDNSTLGILKRELFHLDGENVVMQLAVGERDIRLDGQVRANARPAEHPGVILTFDSKHGRLSYPCDTYTHWQCNVRGIALSLAALRSVDRYGVTRHGEQYAGSRQIPSSTGGGGDPYEVLAAHSGMKVTQVRRGPKVAYREAARNTHPDHGGDADDFDAVNAAARTVGVA